jgi:hypothetical protein
MTQPIDWTDETPRPLDELARLAFPNGGVTAESLKRRARQGLLVVTRPGKAYLSTLVDVRKMVEACRVKPTQPLPAPGMPGPDEIERSKSALDAALARSAQDAVFARIGALPPKSRR